MGVPKLKKKIELNYRIGRKDCWCSDCVNFVEHFAVQGRDGKLLRVDARCTVLGLKNSHRYKITEIHTCDAFTGHGSRATDHASGASK